MVEQLHPSRQPPHQPSHPPPAAKWPWKNIQVISGPWRHQSHSSPLPILSTECATGCYKWRQSWAASASWKEFRSMGKVWGHNDQGRDVIYSVQGRGQKPRLWKHPWEDQLAGCVVMCLVSCMGPEGEAHCLELFPYCTIIKSLFRDHVKHKPVLCCWRSNQAKVML